MDLKSIGNRVPKVSRNAFLALAVMAVVGFAATVACISNAATATVKVDSPFEIKYLSLDGQSWQPSLDLGSAHGGEVISVTANLINHANNAQKAKTSVTCSGFDLAGAPENLNCTAFSGDATLTYPSGSTQIVCDQTTNPGHVVFVTQTGSYEFPPGSDNVNTLSVKLAQGYQGYLSCVAQAFPA